MRTPESPGFWRADNLAAPEQIQAVSGQLVTLEYILAEEPIMYRLPATDRYQFRTLAIISNLVPRQRRGPLSLMSAAIQEQTHLTPAQALAQHQPFHGRRTIFEIGLDVEEGPEGKVPADTMYLKLAHYETTTLRELEKEAGDRLLAYIRRLRSKEPDPAELDEEKVAAEAAFKSFRRRASSLKSRAAYGDATSDEAETLLVALRVRGAPIRRGT